MIFFPFCTDIAATPIAVFTKSNVVKALLKYSKHLITLIARKLSWVSMPISTPSKRVNLSHNWQWQDWMYVPKRTLWVITIFPMHLWLLILEMFLVTLKTFVQSMAITYWLFLKQAIKVNLDDSAKQDIITFSVGSSVDDMVAFYLSELLTLRASTPQSLEF